MSTSLTTNNFLDMFKRHPRAVMISKSIEDLLNYEDSLSQREEELNKREEQLSVDSLIRAKDAKIRLLEEQIKNGFYIPVTLLPQVREFQAQHPSGGEHNIAYTFQDFAPTSVYTLECCCGKKMELYV